MTLAEQWERFSGPLAFCSGEDRAKTKRAFFEGAAAFHRIAFERLSFAVPSGAPLGREIRDVLAQIDE
jgi:hypothetical protein